MARSFQVGDHCRVRQWDDMAAEFGLEEHDDDPDYDDEEDGEGDGDVIACEFSFVSPMRCMCGRAFTVSKIDAGRYYSEEKVEGCRAYGSWSISADMLEYDLGPEDLSVDSETIGCLFELIDAL